MKKLVFLSCLLALFAAPTVFAHDGALGTAQDAYSMTLSPADIVHYEPENTNPDDHKGWFTVYVVNSTAVAWTGYQFGISATGGGVYFPTTAVNVMRGPVFPVEYDYYNNGGNYATSFANGNTLLTFDFASKPVQTGEIVKFAVYTDNTTNMNSLFTICMTPTPEPVTVALLGLGSLFVAARRKR